MNDTPAKIKQQIIDKIKTSNNILITVSRDPSVDDLSAALGLTALLNKLGKHPTAIFSGNIPPAITFLEPDKTFENTIDSLRDFIIALDKEKADHLRYKVDGDVVKIFITPYRTVITGEDLEFSQGDYNVELVLALGVENQEHLDMALAAHGQILHDVTVASLSAGSQISKLGSMEWHEDTASSLSEMVTSLADVLKTDASLLDKQVATALLTGIVAATDRFSNPKTSAAVMSMAAQLMAAGADQQLIAAKLQESHEINSLSSPSNNAIDGVVVNLSADQGASTLPPDNFVISHGDTASVAPLVAVPEPVLPPVITENVVQPIVPPSIVAPITPSEIAQSYNNMADAIAAPADGTLPPMGAMPTQPDSMISTHGPDAPMAMDTTVSPEPAKLIDIFDNDQPDNVSVATPPIGSVASPMPDMANSRESDEARAAIDAALNSQSVTLEPILPPAPEPVVDLPMPPPLPDFSSMSNPAAPDFSVDSAPVIPPVTAPVSDDPAQFRIPGQ